MYRMFMLCVSYLTLCTALHLQAQTQLPFSAVLMTKMNGFGQVYITNALFPRDEVKKKWDEGWHISHVAQGNGSWSVVMNTNTGYSSQQYLIQDTIPVRKIESEWDKSYRITALTFGNGVWTVVLTANSGIASQALSVSDSFPHAFVNAYNKIGYRIGAINHANGQWAVVMNTQGFILTQQDYLLSEEFPEDSIRNRLSHNEFINTISYSGEQWALSVNSYSPYRGQVLLQEKFATREEIEQRWNDGFRITGLCSTQPLNDIYGKKIKQQSIATQSVDIILYPTELNSNAYGRYIHRNAPSADAYVAVQRLAYKDIKAQNWQAAKDTFTNYLPDFSNDTTKRMERTIDLLEAKDENITVTNIGDSVNSPTGEWDPNPTADGTALYMTCSGRPDGSGGEDVFYSERINGKWSKSKNIGFPINNRQNETIDNVSADGNTLYLSGNFQGSFGEFDIYTAERTSTGWQQLRQLPYPINSPYHDESGGLSADGKALIFTSSRPGGIGPFVPRGMYVYHGSVQGNMDIYVTLKTDKGWSPPINLGPTINTPYAERSAFLHPDGKTLYFSSEGHYGLGGLDVMKSVRLKEDSWTEWSEPINIGKQINSPNDDWGYKINITGDTAYFAAQNREGGFGDWDIYTATVSTKVKPQKLATIRGKVLDPKGKPLDATIRWEDLSTKKQVGELKSNPRDGSYFIALPLGKNYGYFAEKKGYYSASKNIDLRKKKEAVSVTENIVLVPLEEILVGKQSIRINNIFFDTEKFELQEESFPELQRLVTILKENPTAKIEIAGHTDDKGSESYNQELSQKRADAVMEYLVKAGGNPASISAKGYGKRKPIAKNSSEEARAQNRRVEFRVVK